MKPLSAPGSPPASCSSILVQLARTPRVAHGPRPCNRRSFIRAAWALHLVNFRLAVSFAFLQGCAPLGERTPCALLPADDGTAIRARLLAGAGLLELGGLAASTSASVGGSSSLRVGPVGVPSSTSAPAREAPGFPSPTLVPLQLHAGAAKVNRSLSYQACTSGLIGSFTSA